MKNKFTISQEEEFLKFLKHYQNLIIKVASIYCRLEEDRKDLIQEIIIQLWRSFPNYNDAFALSTWAYRIALNVSISHVRKTATRKTAILEWENSVSLIQFQEDYSDEQLKRLYDCIEFLRPFDKAIIGLHLEGCKNKEISQVLGISISNVSTRLARIKEQLKNKFDNK